MDLLYEFFNYSHKNRIEGSQHLTSGPLTTKLISSPLSHWGHWNKF